MKFRTSATTALGRSSRIAFFRARVPLLSAAMPAIALVTMWMSAAPAYGQRVFGLDTSSAANFDVSQEQWDAAYNSGWAALNIPSFQFAIVRSSRGGTTDVSLDDDDFYNNISRATNAGMLAGSYHFARPDSALHTAADDAQHYLNRAGMYMKPGYLLPVFDLEDGNVENTMTQLTDWGLAFIDTIYQAKGIRPIVYTSSSYNTDEVDSRLAFSDSNNPKTTPFTYQWLARPSGSITTGEPGAATGYPDPYGVWDPAFTTKSASTDPAVKPWVFWQNGSAHIDPGGANGFEFLVDFNAANGNLEFVKDFLVPALWTAAGNGDWGTTANWNSDNPAYNGTIESGPAPRLPNNSSLDWVKLQNSNNATVTISSGTRTVRKFYTQQPLNITGGSLTVNYIPGDGGKWDVPSEFNDTVTLSTGASYTAHTTQVDSSNTLGLGLFNINGGTVNFREIQLASHASTPGKIVMGGNATFGDFNGTGTAVIRSTGGLSQSGKFDLGSANRTLTINNGGAAVDVSIQAVITGTAAVGTGGLTKTGTGTLQLTATNTYTGGTVVNQGILRITKDVNLGAVPGSPDSTNIVLNGGTLQTGSEVASLSLGNAGSGYTSFPTLSFNGGGADAVAPTGNIIGRPTTIQVTNGGSGYTGTAKVVIVGGGGTGATATATMSGGAVSSITVSGGSGYTSVPTVYITDGSGQGVAGNGATAVVSGVLIQGVSPTSPGFDYASPTVTLSGGGGGTGAAVTATPTTTLTLSSNRGIQLGGSGGTLNQTSGTTLTVGGIISSTGGGALTKSGLGTLVLTGANTYTGATNVSAGTLQIGNGGTTGSLADTGGIADNSALIFNRSDAYTYGGVISGTGTVTKAGGGTLTFNGANTYAGATTISAGTLQIGNGGTTGSVASASVVNNSALSFNRSNDLTYAGVVSGTGTLTKLGAGKLTLTAANTYAGTTTISAGTLEIGNGLTTGSLASTNAIVNNNALIFNRGNAYSFGGAISGSGTVTKLGTGTTTLSGTNSYAGNTIINNGVLEYTTSANLGSGSNSIDFGGGTLRTLAAGTQTRNVTFNAAGGTIDTNGVNSTFSGTLSGAGGLTKIGAGTLALTGTNTYVDATSVNAGVLALSGASAQLSSEYIEVLGSTDDTYLQIQADVTNGIADTSILSLLGGGDAGEADRGYADLSITETVAALLLNGVSQAPGTYGSTSSGAMFQNDEYFAGTGMIAIPALGDYNGDFKANAADYVMWRKDPTTSGGANGYETWRENFGQAAAASPVLGGPSSVPEPASVGLMLLGLAAIASRRSRR